MKRLVACAALLLVSVFVVAEDPKQAELAKKPQWQRMLTGEDAKKAAELLKSMKESELTDDYAGAKERIDELIALRVRIQGEDHHEVATARDYRIMLTTVGDLSADDRRAWRKSYAGFVQGIALQNRGQYQQAHLLLDEWLDRSRAVLGENHSLVAQNHNNLAANLNAQGKLAESMAHFRKSLEIHLKVYGENHPATAMSYNNTAYLLFAQGKPAEAEPIHRKALAIRREILGENHAETAQSYNNVASMLTSQNRYAEAAAHLQQALEIRRKVLGENHPDTGISYSNIASNLGDLGRHTEATPLLRKALEISIQTFGESHPRTAQCYHGIASNLNSLGRFAEAAPILRKSLDIRRAVLGEDHPTTATGYSAVANNLSLQGKTAEALPLFRKALDIRRKTLGEDHPETASSFSSLATTLVENGEALDAVPYHAKAMEIQLAVHGENHLDTALSYNNFAACLNAIGQHDKAAPFDQKALDIRRKILGPSHPLTAQSYNNVAYNLDIAGRSAEATEQFQKALDIYGPTLGENHPETALCCLNVAISLFEEGRLDEATVLLRRAIAAYESSRISGAVGVDRAILKQANPRQLLAVVQRSREPTKAWNELERSLARGLLDRQIESLDLTPGEKAERAILRERLIDQQSRILPFAIQFNRSAADNAQYEDLLRQRRSTEDEMVRLALSASDRAVAADSAIRRALPSDSALLLWIDIEVRSGRTNEHHACVVRSTGDPNWVRLPGTGPERKWTKDDSILPEKYRTALAGNASQNEVDTLAKKLHDQRIAPVLKLLDGVKTLYIVPAHEMAGIPFETLASRYTVSYVPSGTYLARAWENARLTGNRLLAIGDPICDAGEKKLATARSLPTGGLLVTQVVPGSAAAGAKIAKGDVLLKYGETELKDLESLKAAVEANAKSDLIPVTVWRETAEKPFVREVKPGRMGVVLDPDPAPTAIAARRKTDAMLASLRGGEWKDLPGTRVETNRLQQLFGDSAKVLTDSDASEESLESLRKLGELSKYRYIHFATHGEGNSVRAFESSLILSQDKLPKDALPKAGEPWINGQLSAREVLDYWKLDAELVTLSACETAIGKSGGGDGMLGFAQAFLTAGARSVCLSLWKVDDAATALLMSRFYENLLGKREGLTKPMGKAAALDEAKRWLRNLSGEEATALTAKISNGIARGTRGKGVDLKVVATETKDAKPFAHPKYWAAFILIGNPE